jgi:arsenate reductase (glutaredoxin)
VCAPDEQTLADFCRSPFLQDGKAAKPLGRALLSKVSQKPLLAQANPFPLAGTSMKQKLTVYQKPTCTKCRMTLRLLKEHAVDFEAINYYETPITEAALRELLKKLGLRAYDILRKNEPVAKKLGIGKREFSDGDLIALMAKHPDLIQRPIVVRGDQAVLCRPPENVKKLL